MMIVMLVEMMMLMLMMMKLGVDDDDAGVDDDDAAHAWVTKRVFARGLSQMDPLFRRRGLRVWLCVKKRRE